LSVALEAVGQPEPFPRESIKDSLAEVAERRMTKIMSCGRRLNHDVIKTAKIIKQVMILDAEQPHRDRPSHSCNLDRMGQPVMHDATRCHRADHLRHIGKSGEGRCESNPFQVSARCGLARRVQQVWLLS
jgi:hypothetical protein